MLLRCLVGQMEISQHDSFHTNNKKEGLCKTTRNPATGMVTGKRTDPSHTALTVLLYGDYILYWSAQCLASGCV